MKEVALDTCGRLSEFIPDLVHTGKGDDKEICS